LFVDQPVRIGKGFYMVDVLTPPQVVDADGITGANNVASTGITLTGPDSSCG